MPLQLKKTDALPTMDTRRKTTSYLRNESNQLRMSSTPIECNCVTGEKGNHAFYVYWYHAKMNKHMHTHTNNYVEYIIEVSELMGSCLNGFGCFQYGWVF